MNKNTEQEPAFSYQRPTLRLDRENKKVLGVCGGFARYLEVPPALVRVIYVIACLVSPFLILVYLLLYWLMEDEKRPERLKAAMSAYMPGTPGTSECETTAGNDASRQQDALNEDAGNAGGTGMDESETAEAARMQTEPGRRFDLKKPLYRSRTNVRVGGVCAGIADYLNVNVFLVRLIAFASIFILGGVTFWAYVICWIVLDKEPKSLQKSRRDSSKAPKSGRADESESARRQAANAFNIQACAERLHATEQRLRNAEAYITSRQFRLHCEINRI